MRRVFLAALLSLCFSASGISAMATTYGAPERPFQAEFDHVTDLLGKRQFAQAEAAVKVLLPKYDWGPNIMPNGSGQQYYPGTAFTSYFRYWENACNKAGNSGEMERIYETSINVGNASGKRQTFEFQRLCILAVAKSDELRHPDKVAQFCKTILSLGNTASEAYCRDLTLLANKINHGQSAITAAAIYKLIGNTPECAVDLVGDHSVQLRKLRAPGNLEGAAQMINSGAGIISRSIKDPRVNKAFLAYAKQAIDQKSYDGIAVVFTSWVTKVNAYKVWKSKSIVKSFAENPDVEILSDLIAQVGYGSNPRAAIPLCKLQIEIAEKSHENDGQMVKMYSNYRGILRNCGMKKEETGAAAQLQKYSSCISN